MRARRRNVDDGFRGGGDGGGPIVSHVSTRVLTACAAAISIFLRDKEISSQFELSLRSFCVSCVAPLNTDSWTPFFVVKSAARTRSEALSMYNIFTCFGSPCSIRMM